MASKLYLVDGMSHIYRAYYAIRGLTNRKGLPTNAIYGFTTMLRKLIQEEKPPYLGVAIDLSGPTVRHEQFEDYKATRRPMPEDLAEQIPYILKVCEVLRVPVLSYPGYEADDVIGTLARQAVEAGLKVVIVTIDKDMFQLVSEHVQVLDTRTMTRIGPREVEEKFGVPPHRVVDVLALVGDSSDNIPGAPGIGEKGARQLIQQFGSLEELLARSGEVERKTYRESLQQNESLIRQSRQLLTIHRDLDLSLNLEKLRHSEPDREAARELFTELEFTSLLEEFLPRFEQGEVEYGEVDRPARLRELARSLQDRPASLCLVYEPDYLVGKLKGVSVAERPGRAWFVSEQALAGEEGGEALRELVQRPGTWILHDLKPLHVFAHRLNWQLQALLQDTMLEAYLLAPNQNNFSLDKLSLEYLQRRLQGAESKDLFSQGDSRSFCERADVALQLYQVLHPRLVARGLEGLLREIEIPLVEVLAAMEETGVKVDCRILETMSREMDQEIERLTRSIYELAGEEFNINSPRQLAVVLFERLQLPQPRKTRKAGHFATGVEVLENLAEEHEIARLILEYRELSKLKNTYLDALPKLVSPHTGRIHTSYNQMVAATGRLSSSNPNLQNIPIKSEMGRQIRRAFIAEPGFQILAADYSQIELRVMAHLSQDPVLVEAFQRGEDIHERTAREVFGPLAQENPQEFRRHAKVINFGIMYGLSAYGLAQSLKIDRKEAQRFIDDYFRRYQGVKKWIDETLEQARRSGYVSTLFGRIRQIPEIHSKNWNLRTFGERTAINAPIQGTAADLIKKAMVEIFREMKQQHLGSRLIMQVHDELVFEVAREEQEELSALVRRKMEGAAQLRVPLKVDLGIGPSWYEAK